MKKIDIISSSLSIVLLGLSLSTSVAQTTKEMVRAINEEYNPDASHTDDPYYCFTHSSEKESVEVSFTEEGVMFMGVLKVAPPAQHATEGANAAFFFFLTGSWIDDSNASFDMYMFDPEKEIIEESEQEVLLKVLSDSSISLEIVRENRTIVLDQVICEDSE